MRCRSAEAPQHGAPDEQVDPDHHRHQEELQAVALKALFSAQLDCERVEPMLPLRVDLIDSVDQARFQVSQLGCADLPRVVHEVRPGECVPPISARLGGRVNARSSRGNLRAAGPGSAEADALLRAMCPGRGPGVGSPPGSGLHRRSRRATTASAGGAQDRKSTRLNSSHGYISYAVFCLKKKKKKNR